MTTMPKHVLRRKTARLVIYVVLLTGSVPILLPFFWMISSSMKSADLIDEAPPCWIPQSKESLAQIDGEDVRVKVISEGGDETPSKVRILSTGDVKEVPPQLVRTVRRFDPHPENYGEVLKREPFHKYFANTLFITVCCIIGQVLSCALVGYAFARIQFRGRGILFLVVLSTMMIPAQITMIPRFIIFVKLGWLDSFKPLTVPAFLATNAFFVFLFRQFFLTIPVDLEDAARIDGCGPLGTFWHVMLPLARPAAVTTAVFTFIWSWNDFLAPLIYINSDQKRTLALALDSFKTMYGYSDVHLLMAASVMMIVPSLVIFLIAQRAFIRGVVVTGLKG
jgi:ABC-type glycerol-3-phosphate transport system permease component